VWLYHLLSTCSIPSVAIFLFLPLIKKQKIVVLQNVGGGSKPLRG
jgi:hypothetical protein